MSYDMWGMCGLLWAVFEMIIWLQSMFYGPYGIYEENFPYYIYGPIGFIWSQLIRGRAQGNAFFHLCKQCAARMRSRAAL